MNFPLRIALRYIFTKRSFHFITVISVISLIGITIGVAALISVLSIFNGFRDFTEKQLIGFDPHIRIQAQQGAWIQNPDSLTHSLKKINEIKYISPLLQGRAVVIKSGNMQVFNLNSIDPASLNEVSDITKTTVLGTFYIGNINFSPAIALGAGLADRIKALPGDTISLISPTLIESSIRTFRLNNPVKAIVSAIFQTNDKNYDNLNAYTNLQTGKRLFNPPKNSVSTIDIKLFNINKTIEVKNQIEKKLPSDYSVNTWYDLHKQLYRIIDLERLLAFLVMSLIIIIAVFNVLASLSMTVVEKKQDIGILKALGAEDKDIRNIFIFQGSIIGFISTSLGVLLGLAFCYGQIYFSWFKLDGANFLISAIPVIVKTTDILIIALFALLLSICASIYPAKRASSTNIINSIHSE
ncbi:ABC transporter permease [Bacteroidetes/Chlorobi group bacterium ChocPot_Mid]|jgi:lipoprotein-releasing system permease protein|nr:MAG: ABC transporter permease [Bacteroidetes/Chlorobi group bacterium ChocPot_Mid]